MAAKKRTYENIERHGKRWRIRYVHDGKRYKVFVDGTIDDAADKRDAIMKALRDGKHIAPSELTFAEWEPLYIQLVQDKRQNARTSEGYRQKLKYAVAEFGSKSLRKITGTDIDKLMAGLKGKVSERTRHHIFVVTKACLSAAVRKKHIDSNAANDAEGIDVDESEVGDTLPAEAFAAFLKGFSGHTLESFVTVALRTGARRNEVLAIRHSDVDHAKGVLRIARAVERTKTHGTRFKAPKNGKSREFVISADLLALFKREREKLARLIAGVPEGADVDLSLVKIPEDALVYWAAPRDGKVDFAKPRAADEISKQFRKVATKLGHPKLRLHDLRGSHETALLDAGVPVHVVAARCGHSAAMLLKTYAERTKRADTKAADAEAALFKA